MSAEEDEDEKKDLVPAFLSSPDMPTEDEETEDIFADEEADAELEEEFAQIEAELKEAQSQGKAPVVFGDWTDSPDGALSARHREVARMAAKGLRNKDICLRLGYTPSAVTRLFKLPKVRAEILRMQDRVFDKELGGRMTEIGPDAMDVIEAAIRGDLNLKPGERVEHAKWAMEKLTGKATQKHELESGTLGRLLDRLDSMKDMKEVLDAGAQDAGEGAVDAEFQDVSPVASWLDENLD